MQTLFILIGVSAVSAQLMKGICWLDNAGLKKQSRKSVEKEKTTDELYQAMIRA